ncbi:hypothetical protein OS493_028223 [Desmophyllum pertusum]|uniref:EGF-like domain-containing protein n=1 Tax=Desmophyllum pertusum TaxID=174260 RepID=A0A9W9YX59_9CNID|nr:hypothetical protein OS493_028223 [Desmophyllum pertusum]
MITRVVIATFFIWSSFLKGYDNTCLSSSCLNGGTCVTSGSGQHSCHCAVGYTGGSCSVNINECAAYPCRNNGTCIDKVLGVLTNSLS